jgi:hypothetical protein
MNFPNRYVLFSIHAFGYPGSHEANLNELLKAGYINAVFIVWDKNSLVFKYKCFFLRFILLRYLRRIRYSEDIFSSSVLRQANALSELDVGHIFYLFHSTVPWPPSNLSLEAKWHHKFQQGLKVTYERNYNGECVCKLLSEYCNISPKAAIVEPEETSIDTLQQPKQPVITKQRRCKHVSTTAEADATVEEFL